MQRLVVRGWLTLTVATLVMLLLRNPYTGSGKFADAFDLAGLQSVLDTKPGAALVSRLLLLGAAALFIAVLFGTYARREDEQERKDLTFGLAVGGGVVAAGIAATWAMSEHASTGIQASIAMPVDVAHLLAVAAWLGGLASLLVALYRTPDIGSAAVRRFSAVAFGSVVVLAGTGIYQSWRQVGSWSALTGTRYELAADHQGGADRRPARGRLVLPALDGTADGHRRRLLRGRGRLLPGRGRLLPR